MAVNLSALAGAGQQFFDNSGNPLSGGKLWSYAAGTTTPQTTYTTAAGNVAHANPIILDSAGRVATGEIWLTAGQNYKFVLATSNDVVLATWDNITGINGTGITSNASNVVYDPAGVGAVATTVEDKLREYISVKDFGAVGDGITDDTAAIQLAIDEIGSSAAIYFPPGTYKTTATIVTRYGINTYIYGGSVYDGASINACHAGHIFQYNWTVHVNGVSFYRELGYQSSAIAAQKNGIHSDDTGGAINGAAYTLLENLVVGDGSYTGIRMHGTHQMAINCVANGCSINMYLIGAAHTLIHNATENSTTTNLWVKGNGHRIYDHYADNDTPSFLPPTGFGNITFTEAGMCLMSSPTMNDVNGKQHFYLDRCTRSTFTGGNFYNTAACRITLSAAGGVNTFLNNFTGMAWPILVTQAGVPGDCYANFFPFGTDYAGVLGAQSRGYNNLHTNEHVIEIVSYIPSVNTSADYDAWSGKLMPSGASYASVRGFQSEFEANAELRILGASITANGAGASKVVDLSLKIRDVYNNTDLATLVNLNANEQFGADAAVNTYITGIADVGGWVSAGVKSSWNFYLRNNSGAVTADNVVVRITCVYRSSGAYI
jgi:hypothetical protein